MLNKKKKKEKPSTLKLDFFFPPASKQKLQGAICPPRGGEEDRSWGVHGVGREGLKGVPLQIFKAAGGEELPASHLGLSCLSENIPRFAWAFVR